MILCGVGVGRKVKLRAGCGSDGISYNRFSGVPMWWFLRRSKNKSRIRGGLRVRGTCGIERTLHRANYTYQILIREGIKITKWVLSVHFSYGAKRNRTDIRTHLDRK